VDAPGDVGLRGDVAGDLGRELGAQSLALVDEGQFAQLVLRVAVELPAFDVDLRLGQLPLGGHGGELAGRHRAGARDQAGQAGEDHGVRGRAAAHDAGDEGEVRHEPVHDAEGRRAEPAAGDVAMGAVQLGRWEVVGFRGADMR
jgi:hypothetical protein